MKVISIVISLMVLVGCSVSSEENATLSTESPSEPVVITDVPEEMITVAYEMDNMGRDRAQYTSREDGELVIDHAIGGGDLARGDIIYFDAPPSERDLVQKQISRIVALPGERVALKEGHIWIDDEKLETFYAPATKFGLEREDYIALMRKTNSEFELKGGEGFDEEMTGIVVPVGHYFIIGDNRWRSIDSRHFGAIPSELVQGKVIGVTEHFSIDSQN